MRPEVRNAMLTLPNCAASAMLRTTFTGVPDGLILETWTNQVMHDQDRSQCFGQAAVDRAMRILQVTRFDDHELLCDGELRLVDGQRVAFIRSGRSRRRTLFTIAHELGHASLHVRDPDLDQSGAGTERLCNLFAGELLMPAKLVELIWQEMPDADAIVELADRTSCSLSAACVRIAEHLGATMTGMVSADGVIERRYGDNLPGDLRAALRYACGAVVITTSDGLTVSTRATGKGMVFLARRTQAPRRLALAGGHE